jgi:hypothetical protein
LFSAATRHRIAYDRPPRFDLGRRICYVSDMLSRFITWPGAAGGGPPAAANENLPLIPADADPARVLELLRGHLARVRRHNARHGTLLANPEQRRYWEEARALERALVWTYFRRP